MTVDGDGEEGESVRQKNNIKGGTLEVKQILSRAEREGKEEFEVMWKQGKEGSNCILTICTANALF